MHATGDTDAPALQLSSDPPLGQDDIVLLLQLGMTRAELDRGLASSLAQSVSLEALSALTGFDQALRKTVPIIDDFRLGTQYSSRTGRPEPTVSVGKRITENLRATVTTGLSDNRELRSNVEWKLKRGVILQGSYDNVNDLSSSAIGNLGADLRWRIEFE
jgi:translocation and assembly module TamB